MATKEVLNMHGDCVYILNNIFSCNKDVEKLEIKFRKMGYEIIILSSLSLVALKDDILKHTVNPSASIIVFFFGYGSNDNIFIGNECMSYKKLCEIFRHGREQDSTLMLFTNTCHKKEKPKFIYKRQDIFWNAFHLCVMIDGNCENGSLLAHAILKVLEEEKGSTHEFVTFSNRVQNKMKKLQIKYPNDEFFIETRLYGTCKGSYFNNNIN